MPTSSHPRLFRATFRCCAILFGVWLGFVGPQAVAAEPSRKTPAKPAPTVAEVIAAASDDEWRDLDPSNTIILELPAGQVIIELAPRFAPKHVENLRIFAHEGYFNGLKIVRSQDNYVVQWGDAHNDDPQKKRALGSATPKLPAEFTVPLKGLPLVRLPDRDGWAPMTGYVDAMPVAADPRSGRAWIAHCYGVVGAGRGNPPDSSNGTELYAVNGQSPRGLDRNLSIVGRVIKGMEFLSSLPRGTAPMGFYEKIEDMATIRSFRLLADIPIAERPAIQVMRTESASWKALVQAYRVRQEAWFVDSPRHMNVCNAPVPTRVRGNAPKVSK